MVLAAPGRGLTVMANTADAVPLLHPLLPATVKLPEVAELLNEMLTLVPVPVMVAPVPVYTQLYEVALATAPTL